MFRRVLTILFHCLLQQLLVKADRHDAVGILTVPVWFRPAVCGKFDIGMLEDVILEVPNGPLPADKKKRVLVIQHTHFIRHEQFSARELPVGGVAAAPPFGLAIGVRVNGLLAQQFGHILVGGLLVAAQIEKFITVSHNALPLLFKEGLELSEVLDDDAHGDLSAPHGGKQLVEFIRQGK